MEIESDNRGVVIEGQFLGMSDLGSFIDKIIEMKHVERVYKDIDDEDDPEFYVRNRTGNVLMAKLKTILHENDLSLLDLIQHRDRVNVIVNKFAKAKDELSEKYWRQKWLERRSSTYFEAAFSKRHVPKSPYTPRLHYYNGVPTRTTTEKAKKRTFFPVKTEYGDEDEDDDYGYLLVPGLLSANAAKIVLLPAAGSSNQGRMRRNRTLAARQAAFIAHRRVRRDRIEGEGEDESAEPTAEQVAALNHRPNQWQILKAGQLEEEEQLLNIFAAPYGTGVVGVDDEEEEDGEYDENAADKNNEEDNNVVVDDDDAEVDQTVTSGLLELKHMDKDNEGDQKKFCDRFCLCS